MQFSFHKNASLKTLEIETDLYKYLIKARRHKIDDEISFRNLKDNTLYRYKIKSIDRKKAICELIFSEEKSVENLKKLHIGWCVVDPKVVEKTIAHLNEIGLDKITFIYCEYSQKSFKLNFEKLQKILINSSCQCGRSSIIKLEYSDSLDRFLDENTKSYILDFSKISIESKKDDIDTFILGCEGGFSSSERERFDKQRVMGFNSNLILKSETAIVCAASKILI
jgi:16S rRNA (uracil1498-N3)-methyltransferase